MNTRKTLIVVVALVVLVLAGYLGWQRLEREARAVDDGVVASKRGDYEKAFQILLPYAERGNDLAQETVGMAYAYGQGVARDRERAHTFLRKALGSDAVDTYLWIAKSLENGGDGVVADPREAREWYRIAANEGSAEAQERLKREESAGPPPGA